MKKFYKRKKINIIFVLIIVIIIDFCFINTFGKKLSNSISTIAKLKIDELTKYYLNNTIKNYLNINTNDYIKMNLVNNNIVNVDIDNKNANILLDDILFDLNSIFKNLEHGNVNDYYNLEFIKGDKGIILSMPVGAAFNNLLFVNIGPKIPIKINFLENVDAYVDVKVENYGINNSLIKLYIVINITEVLEIPFDIKTSNVTYKYLLCSKLVNGEVPSILGGEINRSSNIVKNSVK